MSTKRRRPERSNPQIVNLINIASGDVRCNVPSNRTCIVMNEVAYDVLKRSASLCETTFTIHSVGCCAMVNGHCLQGRQMAGDVLWDPSHYGTDVDRTEIWTAIMSAKRAVVRIGRTRLTLCSWHTYTEGKLAIHYRNK